MLIAALFLIPPVISAKEYDRIKTINIEGNETISNGNIRSVMESSTKGFIGRILFWKKAPQYYHSVLESDINRIMMHYQREGFLNADIDYQVNITDGKVVITLMVTENTRVKVSSVDYNLLEVDVQDTQQETNDALKKVSALTADSFFRDSDLNSDLNMIKDWYDSRGFPFASVDYRLLLNDDETGVAITYNIKPGERAYIGEVTFEGLQRTDEALLQNLLKIKQGDEYDRHKLDDTRTNLQATGLFRIVSVSLRLDDNKRNVPAEIYVREKDNITLSLGAGYGVEDKIRVYGEITKLRFLGGLRTGTLFLKHSSLEPINADLKVTQPVFPTVKSSVVLNPFYRQQEEPAYSIDRLGFNTTLNHVFTQRTSSFLTYSFEDNKLKSGTDDISGLTPEELNAKDAYRKSSVSLGLIRDSSSPDFFPERGSVLSNVVTLSGFGFNSDYQYLRILTDLRKYQLIGSTLVLAARIKGGAIEPLSDDDFIPYEDRFYSGGAFSVRGWQRAELGPKNNDNEPIGGKSYLEGSIELRYPIWGQISLVNFLDFGNVWQERFSHDFYDLRYAAGTGLRYATPIGPIRLDIGVPIFDEDKKAQFLISIGQMF